MPGNNDPNLAAYNDLCMRDLIDRLNKPEVPPPSPQPQEANIELDKEEDGRWIAEVQEMPGVLAYGSTAEEATQKAEKLKAEIVAQIHSLSAKEKEFVLKLVSDAEGELKGSEPDTDWRGFIESLSEPAALSDATPQGNEKVETIALGFRPCRVENHATSLITFRSYDGETLVIEPKPALQAEKWDEVYRQCKEFLANPGDPSTKPIEWCVQLIEELRAAQADTVAAPLLQRIAELEKKLEDYRLTFRAVEREANRAQDVKHIYKCLNPPAELESAQPKESEAANDMRRG